MSEAKPAEAGKPPVKESLLSSLSGVFRETFQISSHLFRIMIPVIVAVKVMKELGMIELLGKMLGPLMGVFGLPGSMGLVWATTMIVNIYSGVAVFMQIAPDAPINVAQATVLATMMLVAHNLPIEMRITQKAGVRLLFMGLLRIGGAMVLGFMLFRIYSIGGWLQQQNRIEWLPVSEEPGIFPWAFSQLKGLALILLIIFTLVVLMRVLSRLGITRLMTRCFSPVLGLLGIGEAATTITIVGMTMGLAYGGGLIINEAMSGRVEKKDVLFSLTLMGLCHSLIEDTLVVMLIGGRLSGTLFARTIFSLAVVFLLVKWISRFSDVSFQRWFVNGNTA